jgi:hypothetical protein
LHSHPSIFPSRHSHSSSVSSSLMQQLPIPPTQQQAGSRAPSPHAAELLLGRWPLSHGRPSTPCARRPCSRALLLPRRAEAFPHGSELKFLPWRLPMFFPARPTTRASKASVLDVLLPPPADLHLPAPWTPSSSAPPLLRGEQQLAHHFLPWCPEIPAARTPSPPQQQQLDPPLLAGANLSHGALQQTPWSIPAMARDPASSLHACCCAVPRRCLLCARRNAQQATCRRFPAAAPTSPRSAGSLFYKAQ